MSNLSLVFKKYSIPAIFLILGIVLFVIGAKNNQGSTFMISSIMMFLAGGMSVLFSSGKMKSKILLGFGALAGIAAIYTLYASYATVGEAIEHEEKYKAIKAESRQNLEDVRYIQKEYKKRYNKFIDNWDDLVDFVKNGKMDKYISEGTVPSRRITIEERDYLYGDNRAIDVNMNELEAYLLSQWAEGPKYADFAGFVRDTAQISIMEGKFESDSYTKSRDKMGLGTFNPDNLPYIPGTDKKKKWKFETKDSVAVGTMKVPAIKVSGMLPITAFKGKKKKDEIFFGTLTSGDLTGSWENE